MLTLIKGWFIRNSMSSGFIILLAVLIALLVIPNLDQISEKLGFDTRASLKENLAKEKQDSEKAIEINKELETTIGVLVKTQDNIDTTTKQLDNQKKAIASKKTAIIKEKKKAIEEVRKVNNADDSTSPKLSEEQVSMFVSHVQIYSIWKAYCDFNEHPSCKETGVTK